jgi:hypothetical protein
MKRVLAVLFGLVFLMVMAAGSGHAAGEPALLFVLTGQSNAGQQGKPGQVAPADAAPVAGAFYRAPQHTKVQTVVAMQPWRGAFGVELSFARAALLDIAGEGDAEAVYNLLGSVVTELNAAFITQMTSRLG